jgi:acyl-CoA thioester hydrolase
MAWVIAMRRGIVARAWRRGGATLASPKATDLALTTITDMRIDDFAHCIDVPVRWSDMDQMSHVNNAAIVTYAESGRIAYFDSLLDGDPKLWRDYGIILAQLNCSFLDQLRYPATVTVGTRVHRIGNTSMELRSGLFNGPVTIASTSDHVVWFDYAKQRPIPIPAELRLRIESRERIAPTP